MTENSAWFEVKNLEVRYGEAAVLRDVSLRVSEGELVALIGPNGAGKTTLLKAVSGLVRPAKGEIWFTGKRIDKHPSHEIVQMGIAHVPEGRHLFPQMTTRENLELGAYLRPRNEIAAKRREVEDRLPRLAERRRQRAGSLSGGEQQMLAIGRALMGEVRLLLLDEPSVGLAPQIVGEIIRTVLDISERGVGVLLVEQNASLALSVASRAYVLELGSVRLSGKASELLDDGRVRAAYLSA